MEDPKSTPINRSAMSSSQSTSRALEDNASGASGIFANSLASWDLVPPLTPIKRVHRVMPTPSQTETPKGPGETVPSVIGDIPESSHQRTAHMPPKHAMTFTPSLSDDGDSEADDEEEDEEEDDEEATDAKPLSLSGEPLDSEEDSSPVDDGPTLSVILVASGKNTIQVIKVVRELTTLGLKEAKDLVECTPCALLSFVPVADAQRCKEALEAQGASVRLE